MDLSNPLPVSQRTSFLIVTVAENNPKITKIGGETFYWFCISETTLLFYFPITEGKYCHGDVISVFYCLWFY